METNKRNQKNYFVLFYFHFSCSIRRIIRIFHFFYLFYNKFDLAWTSITKFISNDLNFYSFFVFSRLGAFSILILVLFCLNRSIYMTSNLVFKTKGKSKSSVADAIDTFDERQYEHSSNLVGSNTVNHWAQFGSKENRPVVIKINRFVQALYLLYGLNNRNVRFYPFLYSDIFHFVISLLVYRRY